MSNEYIHNSICQIFHITDPNVPNLQCPKRKWLIECYFNHGAQDKSPVRGTPCVWKNVVWSMTKQDQGLLLKSCSWENLAQQHPIFVRTFFLSISQLFWDTLYKLLHKANFQNGSSSFRDFCCRMNPILRVASRDLEADGGGLWKCNLFMSARTFGIWKKKFQLS